MAEEQKERELSAPPVVPVVLTAAGAIAALWWVLRKKGKRADRPIIMTGGSFHVWGITGTVDWLGQIGEHHIYQNRGVTVLRRVFVRKDTGGGPPFQTPKRVEIWLDPSASSPHIILAGSLIAIRTDSEEKPLKFDPTNTEVTDDFDQGSPETVSADHQFWEGGTDIGKIIVTKNTGELERVPGTSNQGFRLRVHYQ